MRYLLEVLAGSAPSPVASNTQTSPSWQLTQHNAIVFLGRGCKGGKEEKLETSGQGQVKVGWLVGEKGARTGEETKEEIGGGGNEYPPEVLSGPHLCLLKNMLPLRK